MKKQDGSHPALARLHKLCLSLPETSETGSWGHPNFRAGKRTFVAFEWINARPSIAFKLSSVDVDVLRDRKGFFVTPYGRGQWVSVWVDAPIDWKLMASLVEQSYRMVALKRMIVALGSAS